MLGPDAASGRSVVDRGQFMTVEDIPIPVYNMRRADVSAITRTGSTFRLIAIGAASYAPDRRRHALGPRRSWPRDWRLQGFL